MYTIIKGFFCQEAVLFQIINLRILSKDTRYFLFNSASILTSRYTYNILILESTGVAHRATQQSVALLLRLHLYNDPCDTVYNVISNMRIRSYAIALVIQSEQPVVILKGKQCFPFLHTEELHKKLLFYQKELPLISLDIFFCINIEHYTKGLLFLVDLLCCIISCCLQPLAAYHSCMYSISLSYRGPGFYP